MPRSKSGGAARGPGGGMGVVNTGGGSGAPAEGKKFPEVISELKGELSRTVPRGVWERFHLLRAPN